MSSNVPLQTDKHGLAAQSLLVVVIASVSAVLLCPLAQAGQADGSVEVSITGTLRARIAYSRTYKRPDPALVPGSNAVWYLLLHRHHCEARFAPQPVEMVTVLDTKIPGALEYVGVSDPPAAIRTSINIPELGPDGYRQIWNLSALGDDSNGPWDRINFSFHSESFGGHKRLAEDNCVTESWELKEVESSLEGRLVLRQPLAPRGRAMELRVLEAYGILGTGKATHPASALDRKTREGGRPGVVTWPTGDTVELTLIFRSQGLELPGTGKLELAFRTVGSPVRSSVSHIQWDLEQHLVGVLKQPLATVESALGLVQRPKELAAELNALDQSTMVHFLRLLQQVGIAGSWNQHHELRAATVVLAAACGEVLGQKMLVEPALKALEDLRGGIRHSNLPLEPSLGLPRVGG